MDLQKKYINKASKTMTEEGDRAAFGGAGSLREEVWQKVEHYERSRSLI